MSDNVVIDLQIAIDAIDNQIPSLADFECWVKQTLIELKALSACEITVRIIDDEEMLHLNKTYRNQDKVTNILSFPADLTDAEEQMLTDSGVLGFLGDLVIDATQLDREIVSQNKLKKSHWAHLIIHGTLHLLGFDHIDEDAATEMESIEIKVLSKLNIENPYL